MAVTASLAVDSSDFDDAQLETKHPFDWGGLMSFIAAGAVLFASLVAGSSASLLIAGSNTMITAILGGFLWLGLLALGAVLAAGALAMIVAGLRRGGKSNVGRKLGAHFS